MRDCAHSDEFNQFLKDHYEYNEGSITPLRIFLPQYARWLDCPARQMHWLQNRRVEAAFIQAGYEIGRVSCYADGKQRAAEACVANLAGFGAQSLSNRRIEFDPELGVLMPRDLRPGERP